MELFGFKLMDSDNTSENHRGTIKDNVETCDKMDRLVRSLKQIPENENLIYK